MHAQYIADIKPVEIKSEENSKKRVDVLFQDNTWGASEHENTWIDSKGLVRTDYSDNRGGTLGYITDDKYRNGNIVDRVLGEMVLEDEPEIVNSRLYKKLTKSDFDGYYMPQYTSIILDGKSPNAKTIAASIHDTMFTPTSRLIKKIESITSKMSLEEIKTRLKNIKEYKNNWEKISDDLVKRIRKKSGQEAIISKEDYDNLPDDDKLKITLEKAAMGLNYPISVLAPELSRITDVSELTKYRNLQRRYALNDFKYSFGKNTDNIEYLLNNIGVQDYTNLENILKKFGIQLSDEKMDDIFFKFDIDSREFNGSVKNAINNLIKNACEKLEDETKTNIATKDVAKFLSELYSNALYFNKTDINNPNIQNIIKFIDRVYNPADDNELVKIFKKLQNMTKTEFKSEVIPLLINEDLNIKEHTGYSLLKRIQRYEESAENALNNTIYADEITNKLENSRLYKEYENFKLHRTTRVLSKYNFDTTYNELKGDLSLLDLPKLFDKYKAKNIEKYGAYPAYPKIDYMSESLFDTITNYFIRPLANEVERIKSLKDIVEYYNMSDELKTLAQKYKNDDIISGTQFLELCILLGKICTSAYGDESQKEIYNAAEAALELEPGSKFKSYKKYINKINKIIDSYKKTTSANAMLQDIESNKNIISKQTEMLVKTYIRTRYQNKFTETLNELKQSIIKDKKDKNGNDLTDILWEKIMKELQEYIILQEPEELLDRYIESLAQDSPLYKYNESIKSLLKRALDYAKLYDMQATLMKALSKGIETDVKSAFKDIQIELRDGTTETMNSADVIAQIVHGLVFDNHNETALLFLDKLGLNETYVNYIAKDYFNFDEYKALIDNTAAKHKAYHAFTEIFNKNYEDMYKSIKAGAEVNKSINKLKRILSQSAKINNIEKQHVKIFLKGLDNVKETWNQNKTFNPIDILNLVMIDVSKEYERAVAEYFKSSNNILESQEAVMQLVNAVPLNSDSEAVKAREELNSKFIKLVEYNNNLLGNLQQVE